MNRWIRRACTALVLFAAAAASHAQGLREITPDVKPAIVSIGSSGEVILNGQADRLSPGARFRDLNNRIVLSSYLAGQNHYAVYRREIGGAVHEVWLLTREEYEKLGGLNTGEPDGFRRFAELLNLIFAARAMAR